MFREGEGQEEQEASTNARLQEHHYISSSWNSPVSLFVFVLSSPNDPAKKVGNNHVLFRWRMLNQRVLRILFASYKTIS